MKKLTKKYNLIKITALLVMTSGVNAANLNGGNLVLNLDPAVFQAENQGPAPDGTTATAFLEHYYDAAEANNLKGFQLVRQDRNDPDTNKFDSYFPLSAVETQGLDFAMNGDSVNHPITPNAHLAANAQHFLQATNFDFDPSDIGGTATGQIGFGGVLRVGFGNLDNLPATPEYFPTIGVVGLGDFTMKFDAVEGWVFNSTTGTGGSIDLNDPSNIPTAPSGVRVFTTENVVTSLVNDQLSVSGDLMWTVFTAANGFEFFDSGQFQAGSFEMTATVVPVPAAVWLFGTGLLGLVGVNRSKRKSA